MVLSMTGYGKGIVQSQNLTVIAELKSLNGKTTDIRCRLPSAYKEQEIHLRKLILEKAHRGKLEYNITIESEEGTEDYSINKRLFKKYYTDLTALSDELGIKDDVDYIQSILRIPTVVDTKFSEVSEEEYKAVLEATELAILELNDFRAEEGASMMKDLVHRSENIAKLLIDIEPFETERVERIKNKMRRNVADVIPSQHIDNNRFEQEIIYYLEKLDVNEEKIRLAQHCKYFTEVLNSDKIEVGKKLGFIAQEMGREINTLGSKAQDKNIQQLVVSMKDELEKIKEQLFNVV